MKGICDPNISGDRDGHFWAMFILYLYCDQNNFMLAAPLDHLATSQPPGALVASALGSRENHGELSPSGAHWRTQNSSEDPPPPPSSAKEHPAVCVIKQWTPNGHPVLHPSTGVNDSRPETVAHQRRLPRFVGHNQGPLVRHGAWVGGGNHVQICALLTFSEHYWTWSLVYISTGRTKKCLSVVSEGWKLGLPSTSFGKRLKRKKMVFYFLLDIQPNTL